MTSTLTRVVKRSAALAGEINNDFEDFLGTGIAVETTDDLKAGIFRYSQKVTDSGYLGGQVISSNYAIGAEGLAGKIFEVIGYTGFDSTGVGWVAEYDTRDPLRNPSPGQHFLVHNIAYREGLGGDESFDVYNIDYQRFFPLSKDFTLGVQLKGRWTDDAPLGGYSTVNLRGYVAGNFLAPHYTHLDLDGRYWFKPRWGVTAFAGVGCLYGDE